jgi:ferredoxin-NADP reductase
MAGGAGVAPFIAIFRKLYQDGNIRGNRLMFFNKADKDIILYDEFRKMLGNQFVNVITYKPTFEHIFLDGYFDKNFLKEQINDFNQSFYVCGPPNFTNSMLDYLQRLGAKPNYLTFEN